MADTASLTITIQAPHENCWAIATDFERYPDWAKDVKSAVVLARDEEGRATQVEFRTSALGRSTHYTLEYDYTHAPNKLSWHMSDGDIMRSIIGSYAFQTEGTGTRITYDLAVELVIPLPGFVKRRAEMRILSTLKELKTRIES